MSDLDPAAPCCQLSLILIFSHSLITYFHAPTRTYTHFLSMYEHLYGGGALNPQPRGCSTATPTAISPLLRSLLSREQEKGLLCGARASLCVLCSRRVRGCRNRTNQCSPRERNCLLQKPQSSGLCRKGTALGEALPLSPRGTKCRQCYFYRGLLGRSDQVKSPQ